MEQSNWCTLIQRQKYWDTKRDWVSQGWTLSWNPWGLANAQHTCCGCPFSPGTADTAHESLVSLNVASPFFQPSTPGSRYNQRDRHQRWRLACLPSTGARAEERIGVAVNHTQRWSRRTSANARRMPPPQDRFCNTSCYVSGNWICCFEVATSPSGRLF